MPMSRLGVSGRFSQPVTSVRKYQSFRSRHKRVWRLSTVSLALLFCALSTLPAMNDARGLLGLAERWSVVGCGCDLVTAVSSEGALTGAPSPQDRSSRDFQVRCH